MRGSACDGLREERDGDGTTVLWRFFAPSKGRGGVTMDAR
jgi:hypothetical protein